MIFYIVLPHEATNVLISTDDSCTVARGNRAHILSYKAADRIGTTSINTTSVIARSNRARIASYEATKIAVNRRRNVVVAPIATATDIPSVIARGDRAHILSYKAADRIGTTAINTTSVIARGNRARIASYEATDNAPGAININYFQSQIRNNCSGICLPEQSQVASSLNL